MNDKRLLRMERPSDFLILFVILAVIIDYNFTGLVPSIVACFLIGIAVFKRNVYLKANTDIEYEGSNDFQSLKKSTRKLIIGAIMLFILAFIMVIF